MAKRSEQIDFEISGKDGLSGVADKALSKVEARAERASSRIGRAMSRPAPVDTGMAYGPAVRGRFDGREQAIRDEMAGRVRAMRDRARREQMEAEIQRRMFGATPPPLPGRASPPPLPSRGAMGGGRPTGNIDGAMSLASLSRGGALLRGGGALAGITIGANALADSSRRFSEAVNEFRDGSTSLGEFTERAMAALPVIGSVVSAGRGIKGSLSSMGISSVLDSLTDPDIKRTTTGWRGAANQVSGLFGGGAMQFTNSAEVQADRAERAERERRANEVTGRISADAAQRRERADREQRRQAQEAAIEAAADAARSSRDPLAASRGAMTESMARADLDRQEQFRQIKEREDAAVNDARGVGSAVAEDRARQAADAERLAAQMEYNRKAASAERQYAREAEEIERGKQDTLRGIREQAAERQQQSEDAARQQRLRDQGRGDEAELDQIRSEAKARQRERDRQLAEELQGLTEAEREIAEARRRAKAEADAQDAAATARDEAAARKRQADDLNRSTLSGARELLVERGAGQTAGVSRGAAGSENTTLGRRLTASETFVAPMSEQTKMLREIDRRMKESVQETKEQKRAVQDLLREVRRIVTK
jgi:hypothetical protein